MDTLVAIKTELLTGWFIVRVVMTDKTWEEQEKEAQNHYDLEKANDY
jgi:hypothetical protein